jgi:hypothetical protein
VLASAQNMMAASHPATQAAEAMARVSPINIKDKHLTFWKDQTI